MKKLLKTAVRRLGYDVVRFDPHKDGFTPDMTDVEKAIVTAIKPFTMTSPERVISLIRAVHYIIENGVPGDFVECGVGRGGSMMAVALTLRNLNTATRPLHLFDTFSGMTPPSDKDRRLTDGFRASDLPAKALLVDGGSLDEVRRNLASTGYPSDRVHYVSGKVEDTLPAAAPDRIALLRLDTDWYESTRHELVHLYPRLVSQGIMIVDDYGCWGGARDAVDEYFSGECQRPFLNRIDYTARLVVKP